MLSTDSGDAAGAMVMHRLFESDKAEWSGPVDGIEGPLQPRTSLGDLQRVTS